MHMSVTNWISEPVICGNGLTDNKGSKKQNQHKYKTGLPELQASIRICVITVKKPFVTEGLWRDANALYSLISF